MTVVLRVLLVPLGMLAAGLAGLGAVLLSGPDPADPAVTSGGYLFLFLAGGLVALTVAMLRGNVPAWVLTCVLAGCVVLLPAAFGLSDVVEGLGDADPVYVSAMTATSTAPATAATAFAGLSTLLTYAGAAWAVVMLLLPATRRDLRRR